MTTIQNKKRKHDAHVDDNFGTITESEHHNIESVLYQEMTCVNTQLLSLISNMRLVDNFYFLKHDGMLDEFVGNIHEFLNQLDGHKRKVVGDRFNSDILSNIYQFLDSEMLINNCGLVSKLWRKTLPGVKVKVHDESLDALLESSLIKNITELNLLSDEKYNVQVFKSLANCKNLTNLKSLDITAFKLNKKSIYYFKNCHMPNLTELKMYRFDHKNSPELELKNLLSSDLMKNVKKIYFSNTLDKLGSFESISEHLNNEITHLKICSGFLRPEEKMDLILKDKQKLVHLHIEDQIFSRFANPNVLTNGIFKNLTYLDISWSSVENSVFANLIYSPNLPNLKTLKATHINEELEDESVIEFPSKCQSPLTDLNVEPLRLKSFPTLIDHCLKLKRLSIVTYDNDEESQKIHKQMLESPNLSNLEYLNFADSNNLHQIVFKNPIYSNLKELTLNYEGEEEDSVYEALISCQTLPKLRNLSITRASTLFADMGIRLVILATKLQNNPTMKLDTITLDGSRMNLSEFATRLDKQRGK